MTQMISQNSISKEQLTSSFLNLAHDKGIRILNKNQVSLSFKDGTSVNYVFNREHTPEDIDKLNKIISTSYGENAHELRPVKYIAESLASFFHANGARVNPLRQIVSTPAETIAPTVPATGVLRSIIANLKTPSPSVERAVRSVVPNYVGGNQATQVSLKDLLSMPRKAIELKDAQTHYAKPPTLLERMRSGAGTILNSCRAYASNILEKATDRMITNTVSIASSIASLPSNLAVSISRSLSLPRLRVMCCSLLSFSMLGGATPTTNGGTQDMVLTPIPLVLNVESLPVAQLSNNQSVSTISTDSTATQTQTPIPLKQTTTVVQETKVEVGADEVIKFSFNAQGGNYEKNTNKADNFCKKTFGFSISQLNPIRSTFKFKLPESAAKFIRSVNSLPKREKLSLDAKKLFTKITELMTPKTTVVKTEEAAPVQTTVIKENPGASPSTTKVEDQPGTQKLSKEDSKATPKTAATNTDTDLEELEGNTVRLLLLRLAGGNDEKFVPAAYKLACDLFVFTDDSTGMEIKLEHKKMKEAQRFFSNPNRRFPVAPEIYKLAKIMEEKKIFSAVALREEADKIGIGADWKKFNAVAPRQARTSPSTLASSQQKRTTPATSTSTSTSKIQGKVKTNAEIIYEAITETTNDGGLFLSTGRAYRMLENGVPVAQLNDVRWGRDQLMVQDTNGKWSQVSRQTIKADPKLAALRKHLDDLKHHIR